MEITKEVLRTRRIRISNTNPNECCYDCGFQFEIHGKLYCSETEDYVELKFRPETNPHIPLIGYAKRTKQCINDFGVGNEKKN